MLGVSEFVAAIEASIKRQAAASRAAVAKGAHAIEERAKTLLSEASHPKGTETPSAPGQPPALVSGTLRRSVRVEGPKEAGTNTFTASVGPTTVYSRIQELGGTTGRGHATHLPARPYMQPAVKESEPELRRIFEEAWKQW